MWCSLMNLDDPLFKSGLMITYPEAGFCSLRQYRQTNVELCF